MTKIMFNTYSNIIEHQDLAMTKFGLSLNCIQYNDRDYLNLLLNYVYNI